MEFSALAGQRLLSPRLKSVRTRPAWVDSTTPQIATYAVNLELAGDTRCVQVRPCEVPVPDKCPALGIELCDWPDAPGVQRWGQAEYAVATPEELQHLLPAAIEDVWLWDPVGEGTVSGIDLLLSTGATLTLRHAFLSCLCGSEQQVLIIRIIVAFPDLPVRQ